MPYSRPKHIRDAEHGLSQNKSFFFYIVSGIWSQQLKKKKKVTNTVKIPKKQNRIWSWDMYYLSTINREPH